MRDAYGAAIEVPGLLTRLGSSDRADVDRALFDCYGHLVHQRTVYPATARAAPFVMALLLCEEQVLREGLAFLVADMAKGTAESARLPSDTDSTFEEKLAARARTRDAIADRLATIAPLAGSQDVGLALGVLCVLVAFPEAPEAGDGIERAGGGLQSSIELAALDVARFALGMVRQIPVRVDPEAVDMPPELADLSRSIVGGVSLSPAP